MNEAEDGHRWLRINRELAIPLAEITLRASRSSGPGGQHANVTASRVEASFDVLASPSLSEEQRERVLARAGQRLVAIAQDGRSQARNRELALPGRLADRLARAHSRCPASGVPPAQRPPRAFGGLTPSVARAGVSSSAVHLMTPEPALGRALVQELLDVALVQMAEGCFVGVEADRAPQQPRCGRPGDDQVNAQQERGLSQPGRA